MPVPYFLSPIFSYFRDPILPSAPYAQGLLSTRLYECILICMRTTLILRDDLVKHAMRLTNIEEKTALVHAGLEALIAAESARRLARLGGTDREANAGRRRRSAPAKRVSADGAR